MKYEYLIITKNSAKILDQAKTRAEARYTKQCLTKEGFEVTIIQNKYTLQETKAVR